MSASYAPPPYQLEHQPPDPTSKQDSGEAGTSMSKSEDDGGSLGGSSQLRRPHLHRQIFTPPTEGLNHGKDILFQALPIDVIELIFCDACKFNPNIWLRGLHPFELAKVCRAWRNFLLSSPLLWDTVVLNLPLSNGPIEIELLKEWLVRANVRPLKIFIKRGFSPQLISPSMTSSVFRTLLQVSAQWQVLWLEIPPAWFSLYNLQRLPFLPLLQSLTLEKAASGMPGTSNTKFTVDVPSASKLTHLGVAGIQADSLSLPWKQIKSLIVKQTRCDIAHGILSKCSRLKEATVTNPIPKTFPIPELKTNPLTCFAVDEAVDNRSLELTFRSLIFPHMSSLSITLQADTYVPQTIYGFVQRSQCNLLRLDFGCPISREDILIDLLTELHTLQELHLTHLPLSLHPRLPHHPSNPPLYQNAHAGYGVPNPGLTSVFFEVMHPDTDASYLPNLEVFTYKGPLMIHAIDVLEPLILRTGVRSKFDEWDQPPSFSGDSEAATPRALLRKVKIRADQIDAEGEVAFTIAEYTDVSYVWDIIQLVEAGTFELVNEDGSMWL